MFGGNAGAAARAVKNTGMGALRLVQPSFQDENEALMFAHGAEDVLRQASRLEDLGEAVADGRRVVGFTARLRKRRGYTMLRDFTEAWVEEALQTQPLDTHLVFGNEREGLRTQELDHCTELVWIPSSPEHPSYNLAQAVLLTGYEFLMARFRQDPKMPALKPRQTRTPRPDHLSSAKEQEELFAHLRAAFLEIGYAHPHTVDSLMRSYREIFSRARLYRREAHMIRGLARQMLWSARQVRQSRAAREEHSDGEGKEE
jgi:TrmH family RNA methyltransferase